MNELALKYGCNPNQKPSRIFMEDGSELPIKVLSGRPGYINFLDALNGWQLVKELKEATGLPSATSFKHVSPAGAAAGLPLDETLAKIYWVDDLDYKNFSPLACAYARARGADRMSSFGDFIALSDVCDADTAGLIKREVSDGVIAPGYTKEALEILAQKKKGNYNVIIALSDVCDADTAGLIKREVSDGVIAPGYTKEALEILAQKKKGNYNVIEIDESYRPNPIERKQVYGVTFEQGRQELKIDDELLSNFVTEKKEVSKDALTDMKIALITLKYTQSNSVCYVKDGQAIGIGAGQQSRVHCTRLAGQKADNWFLRQNPKVLNLPFKDTITRAERDNAIDVYIGAEYMDVLSDGAWEDNWFLRQNPKVLNLPFKDTITRAERDNAIDVYIGAEYMDVLSDGAWEKVFTEKPDVFTEQEKRAWLDKMAGVTLGSDAFFPFSDNIERAHKSGVAYIAQPGGSVRDEDVIATCNKYGMATLGSDAFFPFSDNIERAHKSGVAYIAQPGGSVRDEDVIATCNKYGMAMAFTGIRLFHH